MKNSLHKLSDGLYRVSTNRVTLVALVIFLLFMALVLPGQSRKAEASSGGSGSPDMSFYYTPGDLYRMAEAYGPAGRNTYIQARFTFDLVFPLVYTFFLATVISWVFQRVFPTGSFWLRANLVPIFGMLFDYLENFSTSLVMARFPSPTPVVDSLSAVFTMVKWILVSGSFMLVAFGIVVGIWRWAKIKTNYVQ